MQLTTFSGGFQPYDQSLRYYHGKDVVHTGCLLKIDPEYSWERISSKIRNKIRKAQKLDNIRIERVTGSPDDIKAFRTIWFDSEDETLPERLEEDEIMYLAYMDGVLSGGLILTPSSPSVLYMHNLGSNDNGKRANLPALILWSAVEMLQDTKWKYIDVGVSFRPTLYSFFKNWQADSYPIIFSEPFIKPDIRLTPFTANDLCVYKSDAPEIAYKTIEHYFGNEYTIVPRAILGIKAVLVHLGLNKSDNVAVYKTYDNEYISNCVRGPIEELTRLTRKIDDSTKAVLVIHEFGYPCNEILELKAECEKRNISLIEDCAWGYGSKLKNGTKIGEVGDYAIYSLPKFTALQYGAVLKGLKISDEDLWSKFQMLDYFKREVIITQLHQMLPKLEEANETRRQNWNYLASLFKRDGFETFNTLDEGVYPGAFLVKLDGFETAFQRYAKFGVETGRYYHERSLFLPVHQGLTNEQLDYVYAVFRGEMNLCSNYRREDG